MPYRSGRLQWTSRVGHAWFAILHALRITRYRPSILFNGLRDVSTLSKCHSSCACRAKRRFWGEIAGNFATENWAYSPQIAGVKTKDPALDACFPKIRPG